MQLWNLYFGTRCLYNGQNHCDKTLNDDNNFIRFENESNNFNFKSSKIGEYIKFTKNKLIILEELQFGNWRLAYRDLFKLLQTDANWNVDLFVYVAAHNNLLSYASDNIISYEETIKILNEFSDLIKIQLGL